MGYTLEVKIVRDKDLVFTDFVKTLFNNNAQLQQQYLNHFVYIVPKVFIKSLAVIFDALENGRLNSVIRSLISKNILLFIKLNPLILYKNIALVNAA
jgi:hypothetical protein